MNEIALYLYLQKGPFNTYKDIKKNNAINSAYLFIQGHVNDHLLPSALIHKHKHSFNVELYS